MESSVAVSKRPVLSEGDLQFLANKTQKPYEYRGFKKVMRPTIPTQYTRLDPKTGEETRTFGQNSCGAKYAEKGADILALCNQKCGTIDTPLAADTCSEEATLTNQQKLKAFCEKAHPENDPSCYEGDCRDVDAAEKVKACVQELQQYSK